MSLLPADYIVPKTLGTPEPEQFGMISLTGLSPPGTWRLRRRFGSFGIVIDLEWAYSVGACPVEYVRASSERFLELKRKVAGAFADLKACTRFSDNGMRTPGHGFAGAAAVINGSTAWAKLLIRYRFLEAGCHTYRNRLRHIARVLMNQHRTVGVVRRGDESQSTARIAAARQ